MSVIKVITECDGAFEDLADKREKILHLTDPNLSIARIPKGMQSGRSSVMIRIDLPNGTVIVAESSMANFLNCARIFAACESNARSGG